VKEEGCIIYLGVFTSGMVYWDLGLGSREI